MYIYIHTDMQDRNPQTHTNTDTHVDAHTLIHRHITTNTYEHKYMHVYRVHKHTYTPRLTHIQRLTHAHIYNTCMHTGHTQRQTQNRHNAAAKLLDMHN